MKDVKQLLEVPSHQASASSKLQVQGVGSAPALGFLEEPPVQIFRFLDVINDAATITNVLMAMPDFGGKARFQMHVKSNNSVTSTGGRDSRWTGFDLKARLFDPNDFLLLEWNLGTVNFTCTSDFYHTGEVEVPDNVWRAELLYDGYRYRKC